MEDLWRVTVSMKNAAEGAGVSIVTGDTKVVDRGKGDGIYINTAGIGLVAPGIEISPKRARPGDVVIVSGSMAVHGIAIMSVREGLEFGTELRSDTAALNRPVDALLTRLGPRVHVLPVEKIDFVQAQDDYVCFRCEGKEYLKEQTLGELEAALDPAKFVRIHRSYVLNVDRLARVETDVRENRIAILDDGRRLPISRAGYARLSALLGK